MNNQYTIRPDKLKELKNKAFIKSIPQLVLILIVVYAISYFNLRSDSLSDMSGIVVMLIPIVTICIIIGYVIGLNRQKKLFESFKVTITESEIRREIKNMPTIRIRIENIKSISKDKSGNFIVKGNNRTDVISILAQIINYEQLEQSLAQIREIETKSQPAYYQLFPILLSVLTITGMYVVYYVDNKWLVGISAIITSGVFIWSFIKIQKSKNVTSGIKLRNYLMILILISILVTAYIKLTSN